MKTLRVVLAVVSAMILSACGTTRPIQVTGTQVVKVQVPVYCKVQDVTKPELPFDDKATPEMDVFEKAKLLGAQDQNLKGYAAELEGALAGCKAPSGNK